jgi:hypothetical protein
MVHGREKFGRSSVANADFFKVLDLKPTDPSTWYRRLRQNVTRKITQRLIENGEPLVDSAPPVSRECIEDSCLALMQMNIPDAYTRRSCIATIFCGGGRGGEGATVGYELMSWNITLGALTILWSQIKTGKQKPAVLLTPKYSNKSFAACPYHALGGMWMCNGARADTQSDGPTWVFPGLASVQSSATKVTNMLLDLKSGPKQGAAYKNKLINVNKLPDGVTAGSLRTGAICEMKAHGVPIYNVTALSGHDLRGYSAMFEYLLVDVNDVVPGT